MSDNDESRFISSLWKSLKRAFTPSTTNQSERCQLCEATPFSNNASNFSNVSSSETLTICETKSDQNIKRRRLNLATDRVGVSEENSFMEVMKNLLSCSICLDVNNYSNQCSNGHLICINCSGKLQQSSEDLSCPVCRVSLKQGLHRSLLAEQLTSELPAACQHCKTVMAVKLIKKHETDECQKRMVPCQYKLFGCTWIGIEESRHEHVDICAIASETVGALDHIVKGNINKDLNMLQVPLQLWKSILSKIRVQTLGSRVLIRQTALNRTVIDSPTQITFKSPMIRVPFSCCSLHGFYLDIIVLKNKDTESEKLQYILKSENRTKICLNYYIASVKVDESINLDVQDSLHCHQFEANHKDSTTHEIKLVCLDCDKGVPNISEFESIFVELCLISERERSERAHGILNSNEEDETNGFISTSGSDSNVVFTLFSPTTSSSRSINTSNTMTPGNEDPNVINEIEPSHEEDIVITVTDNVDSGDDISIENRESFPARNNHSYVAVPSVIFNPTASIFAYSPFQFENPIMNANFQQATILTREPQFFEPNNHPLIQDHEVSRLQMTNLNRMSRPGESSLPSDPRPVVEPVHFSLYYPFPPAIPQYTTIPVPPITIRQPVSQGVLIVPSQLSPNQTLTREPSLNNVEHEGLVSSVCQIERNETPTTIESSEHNDRISTLPNLDPNCDESVTLEDLNLQDVDDEP